MELRGYQRKKCLKNSNINKVLQNKIPLEKIVSGSCLGDGLGEKDFSKNINGISNKNYIRFGAKLSCNTFKGNKWHRGKNCQENIIKYWKGEGILQENQYFKIYWSSKK